jgi:hypothetical protein
MSPGDSCHFLVLASFVLSFFFTRVISIALTCSKYLGIHSIFGAKRTAASSNNNCTADVLDDSHQI